MPKPIGLGWDQLVRATCWCTWRDKQQPFLEQKASKNHLPEFLKSIIGLVNEWKNCCNSKNLLSFERVIQLSEVPCNDTFYLPMGVCCILFIL